MPTYHPGTTYHRRVDTQPSFNFAIHESDFYINTHGVSVTESLKSQSPVKWVYILNKQSNPMYYSGLTVSTITYRVRNGLPARYLKIIYDYNISDEVYRYDYYNVTFRGQLIGTLILTSNLNYNTGTPLTIYPFQSIQVGAQYIVKNVNNLAYQYYGRTSDTPNKTSGIIDVNIKINTYSDSGFTTLVQNDLTISINAINTGYVPGAIASTY